MAIHSDIVKASEVITDNVICTPMISSEYFDNITGRQVFFKAENLQKTGSFKARGACNAVHSALQRNPQCSGVLTHSSGNHGAALAYAARCYNLPCTVVCPNNAPMAKVQAIKEYGAEVVFCEPTLESRMKTAESLLESTDKVLVHPHDDYSVMAGQGTIAKEMLEQVNDLDAVVVPVGGGGMASGVGAFVNHARPECKVFCAEPQGKNLQESLQCGKPLWSQNGTLSTIADGARIEALGKRCFPVVHQSCEQTVFSANDAQILAATRLVFEKLKLVVEPTSGLGVAALLSHQFQALPLDVKRIGVILCGGNVDFDKLTWLVQ